MDTTDRRFTPVLYALAASALLLTAACGGATPTTEAASGQTTGTAGAAGAAGAADAADPGIGHVHAVDVDPSDGSVYLAGHYGLFKVTSKTEAVRVADLVQDNMGFTVIGPKTFLASGHPSAEDVQAGKPHHLGLIRSADAGLTWTTVSEGGKADFHSLQPAGSELYAFDSQTGRVRRSQDEGRTWEIGAQAKVIDLAAHADEPRRVYATTPEGLTVSEDGGATFTTAAGAPALAMVDSPAKGTLTGVAPDGAVHVSEDAGRTWTSPGRLPAPPSSFNAEGRQHLLATLEDGTAVESKDGGRTFTVVFQPSASSHSSH
ncbi:hypothetical protein SAMN05421505_10529 [Sinosporangium album]|uniref:BNR/Asp-box repeat-containing protein n=1 Tax=Sinosporangium album TaxID=504805 RepID=A0A1G7UYY8_9ACTN|nr:sialidase family protein [Sinosporangium album]SDG52518.1 hypothetical protein SAMN05421505_10529 [Sinosporangium album]